LFNNRSTVRAGSSRSDRFSFLGVNANQGTCRRTPALRGREEFVPATVIVGVQWGDEGKAKVLDALAAETDIVVRYQGGSNAGHTVVVGQERYAFHLVPSGILHDQKVCVIANGCVVEPEALIEEIDALAVRGVK